LLLMLLLLLLLVLQVLLLVLLVQGDPTFLRRVRVAGVEHLCSMNAGMRAVRRGGRVQATGWNSRRRWSGVRRRSRVQVAGHVVGSRHWNAVGLMGQVSRFRHSSAVLVEVAAVVVGQGVRHRSKGRQAAHRVDRHRRHAHGTNVAVRRCSRTRRRHLFAQTGPSVAEPNLKFDQKILKFCRQNYANDPLT